MTDPRRTAVIVSGARTPIGRFMGGLSPLRAPDLGAIAIRAAVQRAGIDAGEISDVIMGNVVAGGWGRRRPGRRPFAVACRRASAP
jgi:acetyl-CoA C-acetyltransferase